MLPPDAVAPNSWANKRHGTPNPLADHVILPLEVQTKPAVFFVYMYVYIYTYMYNHIYI